MPVDELIWNGGEWINGGGTTPVDPPSDPGGVTNAYLPWNLSATYPDNDSTYPIGVKKFFPHFFTQFMVHEDEATPDYWDRNWMPPGHVEGSTNHALTGGFVRDRYPYMAAFGGNAQNFQTKGMMWEVRAAIAAKIDGFTIDILSADFNSKHWLHIRYLFDAVEAVNTADGTNFKLWLMADGTTTPCSLGSGATLGAKIDSSAIALAANIAQMRNRSCMWKPGGVMPIGLFGAEKWASSNTGVDTGTNPATNSRVRYWNTLKRELETTYQQPVSFIGCYVNTWTAAATSGVMDSVDGLDMHGRWGVRDWASNADTGDQVGGAAAYSRNTYGKPWMHWASPMDTRPGSGGTGGSTYNTWESRGSLAFHNSFMTAINCNADLLQGTTWNDYGESAHICPSIDHGYVWLDLVTYYLERYKTGQFPIPKRDGTFLFHRKYNHGHVTPSYSYGQTKKTTNASSSSPTVDIVDVTAFLTADSTVELLIDGTVINTWNGVVGRNRFEATLPTSGSILSARVRRSGSTVSGTLVTSQQPLQWAMAWDDMHYCAYSSLRQANP